MSAHPLLPQPLYLGIQSGMPTDPAAFVLDTIAVDNPDQALVVRLSCPEFTSLCPHTGQPDFAHIVIDYAPNFWLVESKSLKLFLGAFRQHGAFHEECTRSIHTKLSTILSPRWLRVSAFWYPRGGIPIDVFVETGDAIHRQFAPPIDIPTYRAR